jgi:hypothetical protein
VNDKTIFRKPNATREKDAMKSVLKVPFWLLCASLLVQWSYGQLTITVGDVQVSPGITASVPIYVNVQNGPFLVTGLSFCIEIGKDGDGNFGPTIPVQSSINDTTHVNITTGTPFASNNLGGQFADLTDNTTHDQLWSIAVASSSVPLSTGQNLVATVNFDITGATLGKSYALNLTGIFNTTDGTTDTRYLDTSSQPIPMTVNNGTLTVVPEPQHTALAAAGALVAFVGFRRWKRANV